MRFPDQQNDLRTLKRTVNKQSTAILIMAVGVVIGFLTILMQLGSERTHLVPPTIDKAFWIERDRASAEYYEQMAGYVTWLMLDVSPASIGWKRDALLAWVAPEHSGEIKTKMDLEAERLKANNASSSFELYQLNTDAKAQTVMVTGRLRRQINGVDVGDPAPRSYLAQFAFRGGRVQLQTYTEVPNGSFDKARESVAATAAAVR